MTPFCHLLSSLELLSIVSVIWTIVASYGASYHAAATAYLPTETVIAKLNVPKQQRVLVAHR